MNKSPWHIFSFPARQIIFLKYILHFPLPLEKAMVAFSFLNKVQLCFPKEWYCLLTFGVGGYVGSLLVPTGFLWLQRAGLLFIVVHRLLMQRRVWALGHSGSRVVWHGLSCSAACEIFQDQWSNLCPLHWQKDSYPLDHPGCPC